MEQNGNQWTEFQLSDIPADTRRLLADHARQQTTDRYHLPANLFDEAERIVAAGYVILGGVPNAGQVFDPDTHHPVGGWMHVSRTYCAHCDAHTPAVCRHILAVAFASYLARHLPDTAAATPATTGAGPARGTAGGIGRAGGARLGRTRHTRAPRAGNGRNCPHCGGWLTAAGGCNKAACPTNRARRIA